MKVIQSKHLNKIKFSALALLLALLVLSTIRANANTSEILADPNTIYHLNSSPNSIGFFPVPNNLKAKDVDLFLQTRVINQSITLTTRPDFSQGQAYALYIPVHNQLDSHSWRVHISHYLIGETKIFVKGDKGYSQLLISSQNNEPLSLNVNMLGRSSHIELPYNTTTELLVFMRDVATKQPMYIGLMTEEKYQSWTRSMDFLFTISLGIVVSFVLLSLTSYLLSKDQAFLWFALSTSVLLYLSILRSPFGIGIIEDTSDFPFWMWILLGFMQICILLFGKFVLSIGPNNKERNAFNLALALIVFTMLLSFFIDNSINIRLFSISSLFVVLLVLIIGFIRAKKEGSVYIVFLLAWVPFIYITVISIVSQNRVPKADEVTLSYHNLELPISYVVHFFINFVALVMRVVQIKRDKLAAEAKNKAKTVFLSHLSHDLKQPLDTMGLLLEHLNDGSHNDKNRSLLHKLKQLQSTTLETFRGLTQIGEIETKSTVINKQIFELNDLLERLKDNHEHSFSDKNITLKLKKTPLTLNTDPILLRRILDNLVVNACKYTDKGGALIGVRQRKNRILIQVWDSGCGIAEEQQNKIFDLYKQVKQANSRIDGQGVGLSSVKFLATVLGFEVELKSKVNKGSVFGLSIPSSTLWLENAKNETKQNFSRHELPRIKIYQYKVSSQLNQELIDRLQEWDISFQILDSNVESIEVAKEQNCLLVFDLSSPKQIQEAQNMLAQLQSKKLPSQLFVACFAEAQYKTDNPDIIKVPSYMNKNYFQILETPIKPSQLRSFFNFIQSKL